LVDDLYDVASGDPGKKIKQAENIKPHTICHDQIITEKMIKSSCMTKAPLQCTTS
jgi:hypothetical protein